MKKMVFIFVGVFSIITHQALATGMMSSFELLNGDVRQCPTNLDVSRDQNKIFIHIASSPEMADGSVFQNSLLFSGINKGWITTESSTAGEFSNNTELLLASSQATLMREEKLTKAGVVQRHTRQFLTVQDDQTAILQYQILTLKKGVSAKAYKSFQCQYVQIH